MTTISLQDYVQKIENLIEEENCLEAAMHCRHILQQHPRFIGAYRLLGKALLEQDEYAAAAEIFQRVLSADPNDFISHVGLSVALKEQSIQPQAHWHLERAFEMSPYQGAIRQELMTSFQQNGEAVHESMLLTPGALARLHFQSGMYAQSANELRQLLTEDSDRVDLEVLLADLLWRDGQRVAAVNRCHQVLSVIPDCIQANAILADIWLRTGQIQEAQPLLKKVQELTLVDASSLDEDTAVGQAFLAAGAPELPEMLLVNHLGEGELQEHFTEPVREVEAGGLDIDADYDWLTAVESESELFSESAETGEWDKPETDWLVDPDEPETEEAGAEETADWLTDLDSVSEPDDFDALFADEEETEEKVVAEDVPESLDWLTETTQDEFDPIQISPEDAAEWMTASDADIFSESGVEGKDEESDWLAKVNEADSEFDVTASEPAEFGSEPPALPDWLSAVDEPVDLISEAEGLPDWLDDNGETQNGGHDQELVGADDNALPGWLTDELDEAVVADREAAQSEDALPGWLTDDLDETAVDDESPATVSQESDLSDWLIGAEPESSPADAEPGTDVPDWVTGELDETLVSSPPSEAEEEPAVASEIPEWVTEGLDVTAVSEAELTPSSSDDFSPDAELADWLLVDDEEANEKQDETITAAASVDRLPDELKADSSQIIDDEPEGEGDTTLPDWLTDFKETTEETIEKEVNAEEDDMMPILPDEPEEEETPDFSDEDEQSLSWLSPDEEDDEADLLADLLAPAAEDSESSLVVEEDLSDSMVGILDELVPESDADTAVPDSGELSESLIGLLDDLAPIEPEDEEDDQPIAAADLPDWLMDMAPKELDTESQTSEAATQPTEEDDLTMLTDLLGKSEDTDTEMDVADLEEDLAWLTPINDEDDVETEASKIMTGWLSSDPGLSDEAKGWTDELLDSTETFDEEIEGELGGTIDWLEGLATTTASEETQDVVESASESDDEAVETTIKDELLPEADDELAWLAGINAENTLAESEEFPASEPELEMTETPTADAAESDTLVGEGKITEPESEDDNEDDGLDWLSGAITGTDLPETGDLAEVAASLDEAVSELGEDEADADLSWLTDLAVDAEDGLTDAPAMTDEDTEPDLEDTAVSPELPAAEETGPTPPPDGIDDAMDWLEGLAAEQGAPIEELPSIAQKIEADTAAELDESPSPALDETAVDELDDAATWLEELEAEQVEMAADPVETVADAIPEPEPLAEERESEETEMYQPPEWVSVSKLVPPGDVEDVPEELDDADSWMAELMAGEGLDLADETVEVDAEPAAPEPEPVAETAETFLELPDEPQPAGEVEEEPAMYQPPEWVSVSKLVPPGDVEDVPEELDDADSWMAELMAGDEIEVEEPAADEADQAVPEPEPAAQVDTTLMAALDWLDVEVGDVEAESSLDEISVSDDDLANALDMLDQLDVTPAETAVPTTNEEVVTEFDSDILETMPDDPDEAMNWLANFAGPDTGVDLAVPEAKVEEAETEPAEEPAPQPVEPPDVDATMLAEMPDDPDEAMTWLAELADDTPETAPAPVEKPVEEAEIPDLEDILGVIEPEKPEETLETDAEYLDAIPEDPNEAVAWLEKLAARQGAPAEELPTVSAEEAAELKEFELPDIDSLKAEGEELMESEPESDEPEMSEESAEPAPPAGQSTAELLDSEKELVDALPDWLTEGPGFSAETGHTGWLKSLDEPDVAGWLAGEEEEAATGIYKKLDWTDFTSETKIETGPLPGLEPATGGLTPGTDDLLFDDDIVLPDTGPLSAPEDEESLSQARQALNIGEVASGIDHYRELVEAGQGLGAVIADLETAVTTYAQQPMLRHVLGDAYMRNGQLQKALETYRHALDLL